MGINWQNQTEHTLPVDEFIELAASKIDHLTALYISKSHAQYFKFRKNNLPANTAIVLAGFAEKYCFVLQDEVQEYHWNKQQYTLHLVVMYIKFSWFIKIHLRHGHCSFSSIQKIQNDFL